MRRLPFGFENRALAHAQTMLFIHDHQSEVTQASFPLLVLDAWEHAYYLQYQADKEKYFEAIWNLWNWHDVARRFAAAQRIDVGLEGAAERPDRGAPAPLH